MSLGDVLVGGVIGGAIAGGMAGSSAKKQVKECFRRRDNKGEDQVIAFVKRDALLVAQKIYEYLNSELEGAEEIDWALTDIPKKKAKEYNVSGEVCVRPLKNGALVEFEVYDDDATRQLSDGKILVIADAIDAIKPKARARRFRKVKKDYFQTTVAFVVACALCWPIGELIVQSQTTYAQNMYPVFYVLAVIIMAITAFSRGLEEY